MSLPIFSLDVYTLMLSFLLHFTGPVELAAVGVSIAIFNQASKITIFPLVSITTSFVAEEETVGRVSNEPEESEKSEKGHQEMKQLTADDNMLENMEKGSGTKSKKREAASENGIHTFSEAVTPIHMLLM